MRSLTTLSALLSMLAGQFTITPSAIAQQTAESIEITIHAQLGSATQIIIPQSGCFSTVPHHHWPPHPGPGPQPMPRPVPPNIQPTVVIDAVSARVKILEQTASTSMEITLRNPGFQQAEAVLLLPVPEDAVVSAFEADMPGSGAEPTARILPRDEARRLYDAIVARVRDPALLEFAGYNLIRSSTFPIAAGATQRVRLTYDNLLSIDGHRIDYLLPRSESLERRSAWRISVDVQNKNPVSTVYSPSHAIGLKRLSPKHVVVETDASAYSNPGPFRLSCLLESSDISASLFAYPDPKVSSGGTGGYFLLMAGLPADAAKQSNQVKREVTLVIDRSGSMAGAKMDQARAAALQVVEGLADGEAFNIIDYSTTVSSFAEKPVIKNAQSRLEARKYIENIRPGGGTNIHDALLESLRPQPTDGMLPIVLFLTDGLPTVGQTSEVAIRETVEKGNAHGRRIFTFGVGNDVNVPLLDRLADLTRASATYVLPQEDVEVKVAQVYKRLYGPVLADLALHVVDPTGKETTRLVRDLIPDRLPDLFEGDQLILLGQYQNEQPVRFLLTGQYLGKQREFSFNFDFHAATTRNSFVPRLWASRRIAYLVDQIRQAGAANPGQPPVANASLFNDPRFKELSDEILRLSTEFGILTEYTSFLATEGVNLVNNWRGLSETCSDNLDSRAVKSRSGAAAVNQGMNFNTQKAQAQLNYYNGYIDEKLNRVETSAIQQVCDRTFYRRGDQWIDARLITTQSNPASGGGEPTSAGSNVNPDEIVEFGSPRHLAILKTLITENRQAILSLDGDIIIQHESRNILVRNRSN